MEQNRESKNIFSIAKRAKSFVHAGRGVRILFNTTHNAWIQIVIFLLAIILGFHFNITHVEWMVLILTGGFVLSAEAFNTAIELIADMKSPEHHPLVRDIKDVSAGAVFIAACTALATGIVIFGHYFF